MRLLGLATPVWGNLLDSPDGWVAPWMRVKELPPMRVSLTYAPSVLDELSALGQELQPDE